MTQLLREEELVEEEREGKVIKREEKQVTNKEDAPQV